LPGVISVASRSETVSAMVRGSPAGSPETTVFSEEYDYNQV